MYRERCTKKWGSSRACLRGGGPGLVATRCRTVTSAGITRKPLRDRKRDRFCCNWSVGYDWDLYRATDHPEFDAWRQNGFWVPAGYGHPSSNAASPDRSRSWPATCSRNESRNRYLRQEWRGRPRTGPAGCASVAMELPWRDLPADPQTSQPGGRWSGLHACAVRSVGYRPGGGSFGASAQLEGPGPDWKESGPNRRRSTVTRHRSRRLRHADGQARRRQTIRV